MNKLIYYFVLLLLFAGCADDVIEISGSRVEEGIPGILTLELTIPELTKNEIRTKAAEDIVGTEGNIEQVDVIVFNEAGEFQEKVTAGAADIKTNVDGSKKVALKLTQINNCELYIYANAGSLLSGDSFTKAELGDLTSISSASEPASPFMMGGILRGISIPASTALSVPLYLSVAKISVTDETIGSDFVLSGASLCKVADKGKIITNNSTIFVPSDVSYTNDYTHTDYNLPFYTYERQNTETSMAYLILNATYKGIASYYRVDFRDSDNALMHLQRTHHYTVHIKKVESAGYASVEEAAKYPASNIVVEITDENPVIVNMVTNGQYELGLCDTLHIGAEANSTNSAAISLKATDSYSLPADIRINVEPDYPDWLTTAVPIGGSGTTERNYSCLLTANATNLTGKQRMGKVVFSAGNLRNTLVVVQDATDLITLRTIWISENGVDGTSYSGFLGEVKGLSDNRNKGLHFSMFDNTYSYTIHFGGVDVGSIKTWSDSSGKLSISRSGTDLNVSLLASALESDPWVGDLVVTLNLTDGTTRDETYPIYKTGIFAQESGAYQVSSFPVTGKLYYEVIKVGEDYWLDRNLGATSNGFYSYSTNTHEGQNKNAVGGYYKIKETTNTEDVLPMCPDGFMIPTQTQFTALFNAKHLTVKRVYTNAGNAYWLPVLASTQANAPLKEVYLPMGGYMQNEEVKGNGGGYYWTNTFAYYGQGTAYGNLDPEQKFWQRRLNLLTSNPQFTSDRFVSGSNAGNDGAYKGMSIRCVRGVASVDPQVTLTVTNERGGDLYVYIYISETDKITAAWPGDRLGTGNGTYTYTFSESKLSGAMIIFNNNGGWQYPGQGQGGISISTNRTFTIAVNGTVSYE